MVEGAMEPWAREFIDLWHTRKHHIAEVVLQAIQNNPDLPVKNYSLEDIVQIFEGFIAMITEAIEGKSSDTRDTYMNTVIPGLLAHGQPLSGIVGQVTMNAVLVYKELVPYASEAHRTQIATYLTNWYVQFNADIVKIGIESGATS
jgi:hypothetical protein